MASPSTRRNPKALRRLIRNTKLVLSIALAKRDHHTTNAFFEGLSQAVAPRCNFQITTDGFRPYVTLMIDTRPSRRFLTIHQIYRSSQEGEARYSPAEVAEVQDSKIGSIDQVRRLAFPVNSQPLALLLAQ